MSADKGDNEWSRCMLQAMLCLDSGNVRNYQGMRFGLATATSGMMGIGMRDINAACHRSPHLSLAIAMHQRKKFRTESTYKHYHFDCIHICDSSIGIE